MYTLKWTKDELIELAKLGLVVKIPSGAKNHSGGGAMYAGENRSVMLCGIGDTWPGAIIYGQPGNDSEYKVPSGKTIPFTTNFDVQCYVSPAYISWTVLPWDDLKMHLNGSKGKVPVAAHGLGPIAIGRFPHRCPKCGGSAYVGLFEVDCEKRCGIR